MSDVHLNELAENAAAVRRRLVRLMTALAVAYERLGETDHPEREEFRQSAQTLRAWLDAMPLFP